MKEANKLSAQQAVRLIKNRTLTSESLMKACLNRALERETDIRAWAYLDPEKAIYDARNSDTLGNPGPLAGIPIGVKDIFDTKNMPTRHGSSIYESNFPNSDSEIISHTRKLGGIIMGKTVTTEFAWRNPGPTVNPKNLKYSPGGSSSGSAASVADFQVPVAFGTQTAGSVIRPAAYCGVFGFKPTFATHNVKGVKKLSPYLDTIGTIARSVSDIAFFDFTLRGVRTPFLNMFENRPPRIGAFIPFSNKAEEQAIETLESALVKAEKAGAKIKEIFSSKSFEDLADVHDIIMRAEAGRALFWEYENFPEHLNQLYRENIFSGYKISSNLLSQAKAKADLSRKKQQAALFKNVDVLLTLPASGQAPSGLSFTGDPLFNKVWTMLGTPCITIPTDTSTNGLPLGVQVIAPVYQDEVLLAAAFWLEKNLGIIIK